MKKWIERKEYLDKLLSYKDKDIIKVVTGLEGIFLKMLYIWNFLRRDYKIWTGTLRNSKIDFVVKNRTGEIEYYQVSWEISNTETEEREFAPLETEKDNYPQFLLTTESFPQSRAGIIHKNVFEWLLEK